MSFLKYLKAAFANRWNLLALFGGLGLAMVSGQPDVVAPLVMAGELAYLAMLGSNAKFQKYVDAREAKGKREAQQQSSQDVLRRIIEALPKASHQRFMRLRARCLELRGIARDMRHSSADSPSMPLDSLQLQGLDRLLWVFLRLLFTQHALGRFLEHTSADEIRQDMQQIQRHLKSLDTQDQSAHTQKIRHTLEDNLKTCQDRLANYEKAGANYEFVELELHRLENKITSLAELAVNRQEPDYISSQVDEVAKSMLETERTMNELEFVTGLEDLDEQVPDLIERQVRAVQ